MSFVNEIISPPCSSLLATFSKLNWDKYQRRASSCLRTSVRPNRTLNQLSELLFPLPFLMTLKRKLLDREARRVQWEVQRDQPKKPMFARQTLVRRQMWKTRTLILLVALRRLESLGTSLRVSRSQKSFVEKDGQRRGCPRVSLTPFTFHTVNFRICNFYQ